MPRKKRLTKQLIADLMLDCDHLQKTAEHLAVSVYAMKEQGRNDEEISKAISAKSRIDGALQLIKEIE